MIRFDFFWGLVLACCLLAGCIPAQQHASDVQQGLQGDSLTVGAVQREIRQGMSGAEVAAALGSPNIVSADGENREVWIYDKIATDTVYSDSSSGVSSLILDVGSSSLGRLAGSTKYNSGAKSTTQRTLTIIINFDENKKVDKFSYHSSKF